MSLLSIDRLSLSIHNTAILRDVSMALAPGEVLGVVGESGSGKSMTALSVMQLLPDGAVTEGQVTLEGRQVLGMGDTSMGDLRGREIGMVFQEPMTALNPLQTIGDQVAEVARIHGIGRSRARDVARAALDRCELPGDRFGLGLYPHELSGGQRQRVVIAMAIVMGPRLLIADEPTTALDVTTQAQILALLRRLVDEDGMGLMLISHDLAVVAGMADKMVIMRKGEVVEAGPVARVMAEMRHPYTRALFQASGHRPDRVGAGAVADAEPILQLTDVVREYPGRRRGILGRDAPVRAVDGVSFSLQKGESLGLVGESGCGKSTLTRAILGLDPVQGGEVRAFGRVVGPEFPNALRSGIQVVFQDPYGSFNPRWKVGRLVAEPFHLMQERPKDWQARVAKVLKDVGLGPEAMDRYIHEFSGGQRQRIAIARALILRPDLVILDEAVSALDVSIRAQILDLLASLQKEYALAYLFISHDLSVVRNVTDRVMVMRAGRIVEQGATEEVFQTPEHSYTRTLIDAAPVLSA